MKPRDEKPADIISLSAYRERGVLVPDPPDRLFCEAAGGDEIRFAVHPAGEPTGRFYPLTVKHARVLVDALNREVRKARLWDAEKCRACGVAGCFAWHEGQIIERNRERFSFEGVTPSGRRKLRSFSTGRIKYTTAGYPAHFGRVVGWVDIVPPEK